MTHKQVSRHQIFNSIFMSHYRIHISIRKKKKTETKSYRIIDPRSRFISYHHVRIRNWKRAVCSAMFCVALHRHFCTFHSVSLVLHTKLYFSKKNLTKVFTEKTFAMSGESYQPIFPENITRHYDNNHINNPSPQTNELSNKK